MDFLKEPADTNQYGTPGPHFIVFFSWSGHASVGLRQFKNHRWTQMNTDAPGDAAKHVKSRLIEWFRSRISQSLINLCVFVSICG